MGVHLTKERLVDLIPRGISKHGIDPASWAERRLAELVNLRIGCIERRIDPIQNVGRNELCQTVEAAAPFAR